MTTRFWLPTWLLLLGVGLCAIDAGCSTSVTARHCVRAGEAELCGNRTAAGIVLDAKGLKPGSAVTLSSAEMGPIESPVGGDGRLVGTVGIITPLVGAVVVTVTARTANGEALAGELSFPKP